MIVIFYNRTYVLYGVNMNFSNYEVIMDLIRELQQEYNDIQKLIDEYFLKIEEIDCYIQSFLEKEDEDYKIFSPRNAEEIHKVEIERANEEKINLQQELNQCYHDRNLLKSKIEKLEKIMDNEQEYHLDMDVQKKNLAILNIHEEDRQRIARDLHDTALQNLAHMVHKIELCGKYIDQDLVRAKLELSVVKKGIRTVIDEIRNTIFDLRPMTFDDLGLKPTFERLVQMINENNQFDIDMNIENISCENDLILASIYRTVQECFINIKKHADADKIVFHCKNEDNFYIIDISDNGKGFSKNEIATIQNRHFGMSVLKERVSLLGGKILIDSQKGQGTHIHIEIPLQ